MKMWNVAAIVVGWALLQAIAVTACGGAESVATAGPGQGGGSSTSGATGGTSATSGASTCSTGVTAGATSTSTGSSGSGCGCEPAAVEVVDVDCQPVLVGGTTRYFAQLDKPGRSVESLAGTIALAATFNYYFPIPDGIPVDWVTAPIAFRGTTLMVNCQLGIGNAGAYKSVRFMIPAK